MALEILTGDDIWRIQIPNHPLIEGVLWEGDVVMLLGSEKAGKSILGLQMAFCLATATPFLDKYAIPAAVPVMYIQTEGKENEMVERMKHMAQTIEVDQERFSRVFQHFLTLDDRKTVLTLLEDIRHIEAPPKVIFIDSLYTSMTGDLNDNAAVRRLIEAASELLKQIGATLVIIHHETKEQWEEGKLVDRGDRSSYGSVFLRAWVSHILYLKKHRDKTRSLTCDTQRSGKVLEREELVLIEPNPLCFQLKGDFAPYVEVVWKQLEDGKALTREELKVATGLSLTSVERGLRQLLLAKKIIKTVTYPRRYQKVVEGFGAGPAESPASPSS